MTKLPARLSNQQLKSTKRKKNPMIGYCPVINVAIKTMSATWYIVRHVMVLHCELPHNIGGANVFELGEIGGCTQEKYQLTKRQRSADILHCYTDWLIDYMWMGVAH